MNAKNRFLICLFFVSASLVTAENNPIYVGQIQFYGNSQIRTNTLKQLISIRSGDLFDPSILETETESLLNEYAKLGFIFATVKINTTNKFDPNLIEIRFSIDEGKIAKLDRIELDGNRQFSENDLRRLVPIRNGDLFDFAKIEIGIDRIIKTYSDNGYPFVEISPRDFFVDRSTGKISLNFNITEKLLTRVGEILISGSKKTDQKIVLRELPIRSGEIFTQRKIDLTFQKLQNLGYFYDVDPNILERSEMADRIDVHARVSDARTGRIGGAIGYAPPTESDQINSGLTGKIELFEQNLFGTGRQINFQWRSAGDQRLINFGYTEPWIFDRPISIGGEFSRSSRNNPKIDHRSATLKTTAKIGHFNNFSIEFGRTRISEIEIRSRNRIAFEIVRDSRDFVLSPKSGRRLDLKTEISRGDYRLRKFSAGIQLYFQTWRNQIIAIAIHTARIWGDDVPFTEMIFLGGANTLRGFNEDQFWGIRVLRGTIEYRILTGRASQIFAFSDFGSVSLSAKNEPIEIGYGIGARLESKGGLIRIDYGIAKSEPLTKGKIHVNLGASF